MLQLPRNDGGMKFI